MRSIQLFDKYLNSTMNWAYQLLRHTPDVQQHIAAPMLVRNQFYDSDFQYWPDPLQTALGKAWVSDEWSASIWQRAISSISSRTYYPYWVKYQLKRQGIQVIHAHFANVACRYMHLAKASNIPLVLSFYGYDYERLPFEKPQYVAYYKTLFEIAAAILCEGEHGVKTLVAMGCPREKLHVLHLGVQPAKVPFYERHKQVGELQLIQIASFTEKKGHIDTVQAFHQALADCPNMHLTLVGEDWDIYTKKSIVSYIEKHQLDSHVTIRDFVAYSELYTFLENYQVMIHPSRYAQNRDCEGGAPIILLDAQATGMPIIATTHCDIPDEVRHGISGLLAPETDVAAIAAHIRTFYKMDETRYRDFALAARQHIIEQYDVAASGKALANIYKNVVSKSE